MLPVLELAIVVCVAAGTATIALWWLAEKARFVADTSGQAIGTMTLVFDETGLVETSISAQSHLGLEPGVHEWADFYDLMVDRFIDLPKSIFQNQSRRKALYSSTCSKLETVQIDWQNGRCHVTVIDTSKTLSPSEDSYEVRALRRASDTAPNPIWQINADGDVIWRNAAHDALRAASEHADSTTLFDLSNLDLPARIKIQTATSKKPDWYEVTSTIVDEINVYHATCINPVVEAEEAKRNFVQTLTKTFAHLSIGLAIFDRKGQLALFNPSLVDLTGLTAQFLSARPTILSFFDALRENRRMPEPKDYLSWRQELAELIAAAADGRYHETWSLETGQTYSVQGRPHPDGATAFLIEDISAEVALTRNFRAELELSQSLLDTMEQALAVFSPSGVMTFSNTSYRTLWGTNPEACFADVTIGDAVKLWREQCATDARWAEIETSVLTYEHRTNWVMPLILNSGIEISCEIVPIASAATLVRFHRLQQASSTKAQNLIPAL